MVRMRQDKQETATKLKADMIYPTTNILHLEKYFEEGVNVCEWALIGFIFHIRFLYE